MRSVRNEVRNGFKHLRNFYIRLVVVVVGVRSTFFATPLHITNVFKTLHHNGGISSSQ